MAKNVLKDIQVRKAIPQEKVYRLSDGGGLELKVNSNGSKLWEMRFTSPILQKRRRTSLGSYPMVSLKDARLKRDSYMELVSTGIDPLENKKKKIVEFQKDTKGMSADVIYEWLKKEGIKTKENTHKNKVRVFEKDVLPFIKNKHIRDVDIDDVIKIIETKYIQAPEIATRLYNYIENLFKYAVLKKYCDRNLLADIRKSDIVQSRQAKHMPKITDEEVLKELIDAIYNYTGGNSLRNALKLVLHMPLRAENLANLKWEYIDFIKNTVTIPRELMKIKNINLDNFIMPFSPEVISILQDQKVYTGHQEYVFLGTDNRSPINRESANRALERLGFNDEKRGRRIRLHGFRGTFRSLVDTLDEEGQFSFESKERALDHHDKNTAVRAYNHKANHIKQLIKLMSWWSEYILSLKNGS